MKSQDRYFYYTFQIVMEFFLKIQAFFRNISTNYKLLQFVDIYLYRGLIISLISMLLFSNQAISADNLSQKKLTQSLKDGAAILADSYGNVLFRHRENTQLIPASILKIVTADAALDLLGKNFRFKTEFYLTPDYRLGIKGYGDPGLTSEQLKIIAIELKSRSLPRLKGFVLDPFYFPANVALLSQSNTNNPYDAQNGALVANFNTVFVHINSQHQIRSAEKQTPITPTARNLAASLKPGKHRINLGHQPVLSLHYFSELMQFFLHEQGVRIPLNIKIEKIPPGSTKIYRHKSPPLSEIIRGLLRYSNNFIANQVFLSIGAIKQGAPASFQKSRHIVSNFLMKKVQLGIHDFHIEEGSGLSRKNKITASAMLKILQHFQHYKTLLRVRRGIFYAKTGTLNDVNSYAGYIKNSRNDFYPFVIMINRVTGFNFRYKVANKLYQTFIR
jgi:serine-type D-Ala-D-Ala carboxypeptidase/endopeptidase (penicillin-binding protein 4)